MDCGQQKVESDQCIRNALLLARDNLNSASVPRTVAELDDLLCNNLSDHINCVAKLRPCLRRFPRTIFNVGLRNVRKFATKICKNGESKQAVIDAFACFENETEIISLLDSIDKVTALIDYVAKEAATKDIIPSVCCIVFKVRSDLRRDFSDKCSEHGQTNAPMVIVSNWHSITRISNRCRRSEIFGHVDGVGAHRAWMWQL